MTTPYNNVLPSYVSDKHLAFKPLCAHLNRDSTVEEVEAVMMQIMDDAFKGDGTLESTVIRPGFFDNVFAEYFTPEDEIFVLPSSVFVAEGESDLWRCMSVAYGFVTIQFCKYIQLMGLDKKPIVCSPYHEQYMEIERVLQVCEDHMHLDWNLADIVLDV